MGVKSPARDGRRTAPETITAARSRPAGVRLDWSGLPATVGTPCNGGSATEVPRRAEPPARWY